MSVCVCVWHVCQGIGKETEKRDRERKRDTACMCMYAQEREEEMHVHVCRIHMSCHVGAMWAHREERVCVSIEARDRERYARYECAQLHVEE